MATPTGTDLAETIIGTLQDNLILGLGGNGRDRLGGWGGDEAGHKTWSGQSGLTKS